MRYKNCATLPERAFQKKPSLFGSAPATLEGGGGSIISSVGSAICSAAQAVGSAVCSVAQNVGAAASCSIARGIGSAALDVATGGASALACVAEAACAASDIANVADVACAASGGASVTGGLCAIGCQYCIPSCSTSTPCASCSPSRLSCAAKTAQQVAKAATGSSGTAKTAAGLGSLTGATGATSSSTEPTAVTPHCTTVSGSQVAMPDATDTIAEPTYSYATPAASPVTEEAIAAAKAGGLMYAEGGDVHRPEFYSEGGLENTYVRGKGDGTSDDVPAMLAHSEFVIPADIVAALGNGSSDAGAKVLDQFLKTVRHHKQSPDGKLPPDSKGPLAYLLQAKKKVK